jgi:hypothetical protein
MENGNYVDVTNMSEIQMAHLYISELKAIIASRDEEIQKLEVKLQDAVRVIGRKEDFIFRLVTKLDSLQEGE